MSTAAQTRAAGWYWVRLPSGWQIAEWVDECGPAFWWWQGTTQLETFWDEIDERPIERQP